MSNCSEIKVLITGANGFIGLSLVKKLSESSVDIIAVTRNYFSFGSEKVKNICLGDINSKTDWSAALKNCNVVIHLASIAHIKNKNSISIDKYREVNVAATINLAEHSKRYGISQFIYISSAGIMGNASDCPFNELDKPQPIDPYGISKYEAEQSLEQCFHGSEVALTIIRPPIVHDIGAPGNIKKLQTLISYNVPFPFQSVKNKRSIISRDNLVHFIMFILMNKNAYNQTFFVSDGVDKSTPEIIKNVAKYISKKPMLFSVSPLLLIRLFRLFRMDDVSHKLLCDFQVNISKSKKLLGWSPE
jgi:nucleoside-diphosphate-sugar epimerase